MLTPINEFAKIVTASNGQQVLFYVDYDNEREKTILHSMARFEEIEIDLEKTVNPLESIEILLDDCDIVKADQLIFMVEDLWKE